MYGSPGRSLALEIAARLGLNPSVVAAARQNLSAREAQLAEHLAKIDRDMRALEHEHRLAARERETLEADEARMRQREDALKQREETFRRKLTEELDAQVRQARREIDGVIDGLKDKANATARDAAARHVRQHRRGRRRARRRARRRRRRAATRRSSRRAPPSRHRNRAPPATGLDWRPCDLRRAGTRSVVMAVHDSSADLDVRGKRMRASLGDLRVVGSPPAAAKVSVRVDLQPRETTAVDLNVIGCTVDEAHGESRAIPGRVVTDRSANDPRHSRIRNRSAEAGAGGISAAASAGRARRDRAARTRGRRGHGGGVERLKGDVVGIR